MTFLLNKKIFLLYLFLFINGFASPLINKAYAASVRSGEYELKTAYIYNFTKFITWPASSFKNNEEVIKLCLLGDDHFGSAIDILKDKKSMGKGFAIKRIPTLNGKNRELQSCHIIVISPSEKKKLPQIFLLSNNLAILTISDLDGFARQGGIIGFEMKDKRITFSINIDVAKDSKLKISSELLKLSEVVRK